MSSHHGEKAHGYQLFLLCSSSYYFSTKYLLGGILIRLQCCLVYCLYSRWDYIWLPMLLWCMAYRSDHWPHGSARNDTARLNFQGAQQYIECWSVLQGAAIFVAKSTVSVECVDPLIGSTWCAYQPGSAPGHGCCCTLGQWRVEVVVSCSVLSKLPNLYPNTGWRILKIPAYSRNIPNWIFGKSGDFRKVTGILRPFYMLEMFVEIRFLSGNKARGRGMLLSTSLFRWYYPQYLEKKVGWERGKRQHLNVCMNN